MFVHSYKLPVFGVPDLGQTLLGASNGTKPDLYNQFYDAFHVERVKANVGVKMLAYKDSVETIRDRFIRSGDQRLKISEIKSLPGMMFGQLEITLFLDRAVFQIHADEPTIITIQDEEVVKGLRQYFDTYWEMNTLTLHGEEGARLLVEDILKEEDVYFIGGNGGIETFHPKVWNWFKKERLKKKMRWHDLIDPGAVLSGAERKDGFYDEPGTEFKYLPRAVASPHVTIIYGNKVANVVWSERSVITIMEDEEVAKSQKQYFQYLWDQNVVTRTGVAGYEEAFEDILQTLNTGDELLVFGIFAFDKEFADFVKRFHKRRAKQGIKARFLLSKTAKEMGEVLEASMRTKVRYLEQGFETPTVFLVYGDKVLLTAPRSRTFITIDSAETAQSMRTHFASQWDKTSEMMVGYEGVEMLLEKVLAEKQDLYLLYANGHIMQEYADRYDRFTKERIEEGITLHTLAVSAVQQKAFTDLPMQEVSYLPDAFKSPMVFWVFGDYVATVLWHKPEKILLLKDKRTAQYYRKHFAALKKVYQNK